MISKGVASMIVALAVAGGLCLPGAARAQQYSPYQTQDPGYQQPYSGQPQYQPQSQYPGSQPQYAPAPQYAPSAQYAPAQPQYAPAQPQYAAPPPVSAQLPDYCMQNNAAAGAFAGGVMGSALGGAFGGGRGALIGGLTGMMFGGLSGAQADAQCEQMATQIAFQQAAAQQAAIQAQLAAQAAQRAGQVELPDAAYQPVSTDYKTPSNGHRHRITVRRLNSYSEPATHQICDTFTRIDTDMDGGSGSSNTTARRCKGPDGQWRDA